VRWSTSVPLVVAGALAVAVGACGGQGDGDVANRDAPEVVVTTSVLADVVGQLVGDQVVVETVIPAGSDPHDFQASARQVAAMHEADVIVTNGAGFEEGLLDTIEAAEADGVAVCTALDGVDTLQLGGGVDPHFFADPSRMAESASSLVDCIANNVSGLDVEALRTDSRGYIDELEALDAETEAQLAVIPDDRRVLITNHDVFGYFADRYRFEVAGAVIPSGTTLAQADARALAELAELIASEGVPALFADASSSRELVDALADEAGDIEVVVLYSESLGPDGSDGQTYIDMVRTNAARIADALG